MKKLVSIAALAVFAIGGANAAPSHLTRTNDGSYKVTYDYTDRGDAGWWYMGGRFDMNLMSWTNKSSTSAPTLAGEPELEDESFSEMVFGGSAFVGHTYKYFWRGEIEAGLMGQYEEEEGGTTFKLTVPYVMVNGYYDFTNGLYAGAGLGFALPKTDIQSVFFTDSGSAERTISPMFGLMGGWSYHLDQNLLLDLRYRLAMLWGPDHSRKFVALDDGAEYTISNEIGLILDNSISVGLRYEF